MLTWNRTLCGWGKHGSYDGLCLGGWCCMHAGLCVCLDPAEVFGMIEFCTVLCLQCEWCWRFICNEAVSLLGEVKSVLLNHLVHQVDRRCALWWHAWCWLRAHRAL
jgi:hypothetical protein